MSTEIKRRSVLPGFGLTMGITLSYLSLIVLIPLGGLLLKASHIEWAHFWKSVTSPEVFASYRVTFGASFCAAIVNSVFGFVVAWVLVRYSFFGKRFVDAMVDLPFAMPTAVSGIALATVYSEKGWIGQWLAPLGIAVANAPLGVVVAMTFIGLPFVVRTLQPALEDLDQEIEEASASLGARRWQTFYRVIVPSVLPAILTGFALSFARGLGEYGSVIFIAGNISNETQITAQLIYKKLDQFDFDGATAIGAVMLLASFSLLLVINVLQWWSRRHA